MERITITFTNWGKHQRKEVKKPSWFALSNNLLEDPDLADFSPLDFHALVYLFCQASKKNSASIDVVFLHAARYGLEQSFLLSVIEKLEKKKMISISSHDLHAHGKNFLSTLQTDRQDKTDTTEPDARESEVSKFDQKLKSGLSKTDFKDLFETHYPDFTHKAQSIQIMADEIRDVETFELVKKAIINFKAYNLSIDRKPPFVQSFPRWWPDWRNWIEKRDHGAVSAQSMLDLKLQEMEAYAAERKKAETA